jgi:diacylglycerol kinase family enzyme/membrane-associated phospholipid phosphatase
MVRRPPAKSSILIAAALLVALVGWTWLTFAFGPVQTLDARLVAPPLDPLSPTAQIASAFSLLTWPGVTYAAVAGIAIWAFQRRLRQLAVALGLIILTTWGMTQLLKIAFNRARPEDGLNLISISGYAYPSGHMSSIVAGSIAVGATFAVTRQSVATRLWWQIGAGVLVLAVAVDRWILGAHFITDIVGGALLGALTATFALLASGVQVPGYDLVTEITRTRTVEPVPIESRKRAAVIYNPTKVRDWVTFRRHVEYELRTRGWDRALWLETTTDDPGRAMTEQAVREGVDLVLGAGGDGTIRVICSGLAGSGVPFGLIPAGTGNLLARNIGIPLDEAAALDVAFDGTDKAVDLVALSVDGGPEDHFAVMAGIGIDAVIMEGTDPILKRTVGNAAYFLSAARHAGHPALQATIRVDDGPTLTRKAHVIVIGNVGFLQGKIQLIPGARADDGRLDLLVASPRRVRDWVRLTTQVLTRQQRTDRQLDRLTGRRVSIKVDGRDHYQMDGDTVGECSTMTAEIRPGALRLRIPRDSALAASRHHDQAAEALASTNGSHGPQAAPPESANGAADRRPVADRLRRRRVSP